MNLRLFTLTLTCLLLTDLPPLSHATASPPGRPGSSCSELFSKYFELSLSRRAQILPTLPRHPDKLPIPEALLDKGHLAKLVKTLDLFAPASPALSLPLRSLDDGWYVYVITRDGKLAYMERTAANRLGKPLDPKKTVGTHEGLVTFLGDTTVIAAGEFQIRNGETFLFSNGSGTFRGGEKQLKFAQEAFTHLGLRLPRHEKYVLDYSTGNVLDAHIGVAEDVALELRVRSTPELRELQKKTLQIMKVWDKDPTRNFDRLLKICENFPPNCEAAVFFTSQWETPRESLAYAVTLYAEEYGIDGYTEMLKFLTTASR